MKINHKDPTKKSDSRCLGLHAAAKIAIFRLTIFHVSCDFSQFFVMLIIILAAAQ